MFQYCRSLTGAHERRLCQNGKANRSSSLISDYIEKSDYVSYACLLVDNNKVSFNPEKY